MSQEVKYWIWSIDPQEWYSDIEDGSRKSILEAKQVNNLDTLSILNAFPGKVIAIPCSPLEAPREREAERITREFLEESTKRDDQEVKCPYCANKLNVVISKNENS